jgi:cobyrinic acid a,c-diamide synthase
MREGSLDLPRLLVSAAHKSSGKTTVSVALCAAIRQRGLAVQAFKKGPDYIDPRWLAGASARDCFNLDPFLMSGEDITHTFQAAAVSADLSLVEGNKGLYDGLALDGSNSNAALAHQLDLPVLLVLDAQGMTRGIAPLILGYQAFDRRIRIGGVILNRLGGARHESKLRAVIEHYTDVPVLGAMASDPRMAIAERHLGLTPHREFDEAARRIDEMARLAAEQIDLDAVVALARSAAPMAAQRRVVSLAPPAGARPVRLGVAMDKAFGFYYADDLAALECAGAVLLPFDTLHDAQLPAVDALFIGGGFPEMFMAELQANVSLRHEIAAAIARGMPAYAECGGLMYLARSLNWQGQRAEMVGAIAADVQMQERPAGRGYMRLETTPHHPWPGQEGASAVAHEFHYSRLDNVDPALRFAYRVKRGQGVDGVQDGIVVNNLLASYAHLRSVQGNDWAARFVEFARGVAEQREMDALGSPAGMDASAPLTTAARHPAWA